MMISIIVPVYNAVQYLEQCLNSICAQTYADLEIIIVDDGSVDGSSEICERFQKQDSRIIFIRKSNGGPVSARKEGLVHATGEYIAFVDGDDWIEPDMYEHMYRIIIDKNVDIVMCGRYEDTGMANKKVYQGIPSGRYNKRELLHNVYPKMIVNEFFFEWGLFPSVWDKLFRRESIYSYQMEVDERIVMGDDAACVYPSLLNAESIYVMEECLYHYRQTTNSVVKRIADSETERVKFRILYQTINEKFDISKNIYNLKEQWKKYVLFLMTARASSLYTGMEKLDYLFPFPKVKRQADIILYGAGTYGQHLFGFLQRTAFCNVVSWVDRNYTELQKMNLPVESPEVISERVYDAIVVTITYAKARQSLYNELVQKYPAEKIHLIDEEQIFSEETMKAFGLLEKMQEHKDAYVTVTSDIYKKGF